MRIEILTLEELAQVLKTTKCALYNRATRDPYAIPPTLKIPGGPKYLFDAEVVQKWLRDPTAFMPLDARPKKAVGRPRKYPLAAPTVTPSGKRRGRPPKAAQQVQPVLASPV